MNRMHVVAVLAVFIAGIAGCSKEAPPPPPPAPKVEAPAPAPAPAAAAAVSVLNINLGTAIGPDKKVTTATETFAKNDTIYAVIETAGSGNTTLKAKWTYHKADKTALVDESTQSINAKGPAATEFHISKPDGWPAGEYQVEVSLNDKPAGTRKFTVN